MSGTERELFKAAVFIIIRNEDGEVLLQRRTGTGFMDGYYDFPSGHVDADEGFAEAAIRELAEETSLVTAVEDLGLKHANVNRTDYPYINVVFEAKQWHGEPKIMEPDKCDDMQFFRLDAFPAKCTLAVRYMQEAGLDGWGKTSYVDHAKFVALTGYHEL